MIITQSFVDLGVLVHDKAFFWLGATIDSEPTGSPVEKTLPYMRGDTPAADMVISTAGYNSVHELLASCTPGILLPLIETGRDDQVARAKKASEKGLALVCERNRESIASALVTLLQGGGPAKRPMPPPRWESFGGAGFVCVDRSPILGDHTNLFLILINTPIYQNFMSFGRGKVVMDSDSH